MWRGPAGRGESGGGLDIAWWVGISLWRVWHHTSSHSWYLLTITTRLWFRLQWLRWYHCGQMLTVSSVYILVWYLNSLLQLISTWSHKYECVALKALDYTPRLSSVKQQNSADFSSCLRTYNCYRVMYRVLTGSCVCQCNTVKRSIYGTVVKHYSTKQILINYFNF